MTRQTKNELKAFADTCWIQSFHYILLLLINHNNGLPKNGHPARIQRAKQPKERKGYNDKAPSMIQTLFVLNPLISSHYCTTAKGWYVSIVGANAHFSSLLIVCPVKEMEFHTPQWSVKDFNAADKEEGDDVSFLSRYFLVLRRVFITLSCQINQDERQTKIPQKPRLLQYVVEYPTNSTVRYHRIFWCHNTQLRRHIISKTNVAKTAEEGLPLSATNLTSSLSLWKKE